MRSFLIAVALAVATPGLAAEVFTRLTSFEQPIEPDLVVSPGDSGLTVTMLRGGVECAPPATDGERLLRLEFAGEDGKVEFGVSWNESRYDLAGFDALLMDVYIDTPSALPDLMGAFEQAWDPPDMWQPAVASPTQVGVWTTIRYPLLGRAQTDLNRIWALVFEQMPGADGVIYADHLRLVKAALTPPPAELARVGFEDRNELAWSAVPVEELLGYHVYGADSLSGPFARLTATPVTARHFVEAGPFAGPRYYRVATVTAEGESALSDAIAAVWNGLTDDELLDFIQQSTFHYFWNYSHALSGLARESDTQPAERCAIGGSGMGLIAIVVGSERGWITRSQAANRMLKITSFLEDTAQRFNGVWPHWCNCTTGEAIPFSQYDDAADLVETSYLIQGLLVARQYFDGDDAVETEIRERITRMWEGVQWDWHRRYPDSMVLYWHWSPTYGWTMNLPLRGFYEASITYLLAIASPTHPMPPESWDEGWASLPSYTNGETYFGIVQDISQPLGGPLFFTHYSVLGFDPRFKRDAYTNYFIAGRQISQIHRAYAIANPRGFVGYNRWGWGLTSSYSYNGYHASSPTRDIGTIAPTAALSAMAYTPEASLATLRYLYDTYGSNLTSYFGFRDAFNPTQGWFSSGHLAIDQGPIIAMIENYRSGLPWRLFMADPDIRAMVDMLFEYVPDLDQDGDIDGADGGLLLGLIGGPDATPPGDPEAGRACDRDEDGDVDLSDIGAVQALLGSAS